jgi:starch phosphorylase
MSVEEKLEQTASQKLGKSLSQLNNEEFYAVLLEYVKKAMADVPVISGDKKLYYISAEFLIGKLLSNNLINLGVYKEVEKVLEKYNTSIAQIEEQEPEPSLGNGGLGRLAACFLDSTATLQLPADGVGLNYHLGLFKQEFENEKQTEKPNPWIEKDGFLHRSSQSYTVDFANFSVQSVLYEIDVLGFNGGKNKLKLFDLDSVDESIVKNGIDFDKTNIEKNLTLFLYPDDSDENGKKLRVYQQYFMVSNAAQMILAEYKEKGWPLDDLYKHVQIQINDTHPSMVIPEMIRLLVKEGLEMDLAIEVVSKTCAYTNHTILAEALEKWPVSYLEKVCPQLLPIIRALDEKAAKISDNPRVRIIDEHQLIHMAHMDIHFSHSTNGVAAIHTDILKNEELKDFFDLYPQRFNNKTNGITFRRWLMACNPQLCDWIEGLIGPEFLHDADKLNDLMKYEDDENVLRDLLVIKQAKKEQLAAYLKEKQNIDLNPHSIFDIQIKRLHEYKRQQMNALYVIDKYLDIKAGHIPSRPITVIFGAKAAPAYKLAKDIIHLILSLSKLIDNDPQVSPYLKVVMVENYNVTLAEKLIPAADVSEQISLASKEASGTGNMKFMLNGAITLGTDDGANVEIHDLVGDDNIYIFGAKSDVVIDHYKRADYNAKALYESDPQIKRAVDFILSDALKNIGDEEALQRVYWDLTNKDWFMTLLDFKDYVRVKNEMFDDYENRQAWAKKMLINIAKAGYFSSDRTIGEYNADIWKLK